MCLSLLVPNQSRAQNKDTSGTKSPPTNNYYLKTAKMYIGLEEYAKAIDSLELAILLEPDNTEAHTLLKESRRLLEEKKVSLGMQDKSSVPKEMATPLPPGQVLVSLPNAYTAIEDERYDDAVEIINAILETDPTNKEALYLKEKINDIRHRRITENLKTTHAQEKLKSHEYLREALIPYQETLQFPVRGQWRDILKRTLPELDKIVEENKRKTEQLRLIPNPVLESSPPKVIEDALNTIISFEFLDTPLRDVVAFIREKTNINMIIDPEAGSVPVSLKLKDVPLRTALKYLLPKSHEYVIEGDIIHIYKQKMEMRVYDVRDILINMDDREPLEFDITAAASAQTGGMGIKKGEGVKVKDPSGRVLDLIELIVATVEPSSWSSRISVIGASTTGAQRQINIPGQGEGSIIARMGQPGDIVVVNSKYVHKQIEDLLASLRSSQNLQVSIEARFITVSDTFFEDIGSKFSKFFSDKTSIDTGADSDISDLASGGGLQINYSILNDSMLKGFLRAVQESKDSEILTSPRITLSNTQRGNIAVVRTINFVQSTSVSEGVVTPVIGTIPQGTTFDVRPIVSADRKYVYLEVTPSVFQVEQIKEFTFSRLSTNVDTIGGGGVGTANIPPEQTVQLPQINVSQVSVTVCVPDKGTLMIGGLGSITRDNLTTGIPILSKIPVLKRLFTRDQKNNIKSNLVILLKPTILIREEQEANFLSLSNKKFNATDSNNKRN
jgi:type II secretory pathway component GspD/PulD (secretin)